MKKKWLALAIVLILGATGGGVYYGYWQKLHNSEVIAQPTGDMAKSNEDLVNNSKEWINILVLGTDNTVENEVARSDSIMLVSANVDTRQVSVISVPRDTRVNIEGVGLTKITHANAVGQAKGGVHQGTLESAKAVSNLLGVPINYYVKIDFQGFQKAVDAVGGIDVTLPSAVNDGTNIHLTAGPHHLTGDQALSLARARYGLPNGDFGRQQDQFYLLSALAHQMLSLANITKLPGVLNTINQDLMDSNMSVSEMAAMGLDFKGIAKDDMKYFQLPGKGITAHDPLVGADVYYYEPDMAGVKKIVEQALAKQ